MPIVVRSVATAVIYFAAAKLGLALAVIAEQVSVVWPPTGIALAAVLVFGPRVWPGIALGAFLANATAHEPLGTAAGVAAGNTLEALVGAALLRRLAFRVELDRLRDVLALVLAAVTSTIVSAAIGVTSLCLGRVQPWAAFGALWSVWWIGDAIGALVITPLLLVWTAGAARRFPPRLGEAAALAGGLLAVSLGIFAGWLGTVFGYPLHYTIFPLMIWAALRFGQPGTTAVTFVASGVAIWSTVNGRGPFAMADANESLVMLQFFMAVVAGTGLLLGAAIAERDVAQRRAAADYARLEVSEERLRLALAAGRMGVWDWNIATGEVTWSENLEPIHGLVPGAFPGTLEGFQALVHPDDREAVNRAITAAVDEGTEYDIEFRNVWPDGSVHWMGAKGRVLRDASGRPLRMIGVGMDMTQRRRLEDELRRHAQQLAESDRRKDEFLAMLSHELRNPLAPLATALHLLRREPAGRVRFLDMAERQVKQLARLVDDLLDVSRITQGKVALRRETVVVSDIVARAVEMVRPLIDARRHGLTVSLPPGAVALEADPLRLAQVVANLLGNAAKYTPAPGSISLTAERVNEELVLSVRDTGIGLAPDLLPHVFDLFVQGDRSLDRTRGGLGIGLTIVRRLVEMHGGRVEARSPGPGQGSEFTVHLPTLPDTHLPGVEMPAVTAGDGATSALRILLVEDNADAAEALAALLTTWGHEVHVASDGLAVLDASTAWEADVVLSDLGLPGMDGYELAGRLRAHSGFRKALLVALSGYGDDDDRRRALAAGFDEHLVKPPDLHGLDALLRRVALAKRRVAGAA